MSARYYYARPGYSSQGPVNATTLLKLHESGLIPGYLVCAEGTTEWVKIESILKDLQAVPEDAPAVSPETLVRIVGVDIPFGDAVCLIFKWTMAAIPTALVVGFLWLVVIEVLIRFAKSAATF